MTRDPRQPAAAGVRSPPPLPLDYGRPPALRPENLALYWALHLLIWSIALGVPLLIFIVVSPRMEAVFKDFKVELPGITRTMLGISRMFRVWYGVIAAPFVPASVAALFVGLAAAARARQRKVFHLSMVLAWLLFAALTVAVVLALFMPLVNLMGAVSGSKG